MVSQKKGSDKNVVFSESLAHPLTLYPTAIGILGTVSTVLFGATALTGGAAVAGFTIGIGSWAVNYFYRRDTFLKNELSRLQQESLMRLKTLVDSLEKSLKTLKGVEDTEPYLKQALAQFGLVKDSYEYFKNILEDKLNDDELTFGRFLVSAEQVHLSVMDNLQNLVSRTKSVHSIDPIYIENQLKELERMKNPQPADIQEKETLLTRKNLRLDQLNKINELLTYNELALTQLAKANTSITEMRSKSGHSQLNWEDATLELEEIAKRAKNF
jgi:hypothetical protein